MDQLPVRDAMWRPAGRQNVDGFQEAGLALGVLPHQSHRAYGQGQRQLAITAKVGEGQLVESHPGIIGCDSGRIALKQGTQGSAGFRRFDAHRHQRAMCIGMITWVNSESSTGRMVPGLEGVLTSYTT